MINNDLNSVIIEGQLVTDPVVDDTEGVCTLLLASLEVTGIRQSYTDKRNNYFTVEVRGRIAQYCAMYLRRGRGVRVVGKIRQYRWDDDNGSSRSEVRIIAEHVEFKPVQKEEEVPS